MTIRKSKDKNNIFSLNIDYGSYHYAKHSKDEKLINTIYDIAETIRLGLEEELR